MKQATLGAFKLKEDKGDGITTGTLFAKRNKEPEKPSTPLTGKLSMLVNAKALNIFNKSYLACVCLKPVTACVPLHI